MTEPATILFENDAQHVVVTATDNKNLCEECGGINERQNANCCMECVAKALGDTEAFDN